MGKFKTMQGPNLPSPIILTTIYKQTSNMRQLRLQNICIVKLFTEMTPDIIFSSIWAYACRYT